MRVGLDGIGVSFPKAFIDLGLLAEARGVPPGKYREGIGVRRMAVAAPDEDTVTLAAQAGREALRLSGTSPEEVGLLVVGTETGVDHSKPVASFVQGLLGLGTRCRVFETKHACYGGTAALQMALDGVRAGRMPGRKALVICSDIARYGLGTAGEPTQGAGAVALLVSENPRILNVEPHSGLHATDVHDFWRPLYSKDALVDGHYSVQCYLDALTGAYRHYKELCGEPGAPGFSDRFAALAYHVPYGKMARKAHRQLRTLDGDAQPDASFERLVAPSLRFSEEIGNIYTGSMYLALTSLLAHAEASLEGQRVGLFSYGSGCCAEFFAGRVVPGALARVNALQVAQRLEQREALDVPAYESIMRAREGLDERPVQSVAPDAFRFRGVEAHRRTYVAPPT